jgi:hypothetical protein
MEFRRLAKIATGIIVYARWYDTKGLMVQFFGATPPKRLTTTLGFHTIKPEYHQVRGTWSNDGYSILLLVRNCTIFLVFDVSLSCSYAPYRTIYWLAGALAGSGSICPCLTNV